MLRAGHGVLICETRHGLSAPTPASTAPTLLPGKLVLLPDDPDASARALRAGIAARRPGARPWWSPTRSAAPGGWARPTWPSARRASWPLDDWAGARMPPASLRATAIAVADAVAGAADLARAKDSGRPAVLVRGLERFVTEDDGPGAVALRRPPEEDLFR